MKSSSKNTTMSIAGGRDASPALRCAQEPVGPMTMATGPPAITPAASAGSLTATTMASGGALCWSSVCTRRETISGRPLLATTTPTRSFATDAVICSAAQTGVADRSAPGKPAIEQRRYDECAGIEREQADDIKMHQHADTDRKRHHRGVDHRQASDLAEIAGVLHQDVWCTLGDAGGQQHNQNRRYRGWHGCRRAEQQRK